LLFFFVFVVIGGKLLFWGKGAQPVVGGGNGRMLRGKTMNSPRRAKDARQAQKEEKESPKKITKIKNKNCRARNGSEQ
jgi:hypothetical protein